jgi:hypothetical protein
LSAWSESAYAAAAQKRIAAVEPLAAPTLAHHDRALAPRVPFAALLERGLVTPGRAARRCQAKGQALVRADGAISLGSVGSIHRIGVGARTRGLHGWPSGAGRSRAWCRSIARRSARGWGGLKRSVPRRIRGL